MKCLCCGKEIKESASNEEKEYCWHRRCVKEFFGTSKMPKLDITKMQLENLANDTVNKGLTVPGVQKKLSLHLSKDYESRLTIVDYPTGFILKPQTEEFILLPEFEDLAMRMAELAGIKTVPHALIKMNGDYAYITKRVDREIQENEVKLYAMEDFCQLSNRLTIDKYRGSYEICGKIVKNYSEYPGLDLAEMFMRIVFSFLIGNSDMHLKNFSLKETEPASRVYRLSPAYDMLPVNVIMPEDEEEMALTLNGKKRNIRRKDFYCLADKCGISKKSAENMINKMYKLTDRFIRECDDSYLSEELKQKVKELIIERRKVIGE